MEELGVEDPQSFFNYPRMEPAMFDELVQSGARIEKHDEEGFHLEWDQNVWNAVGMP